jgi:hypothetical protein
MLRHILLSASALALIVAGVDACATERIAPDYVVDGKQ